MAFDAQGSGSSEWSRIPLASVGIHDLRPAVFELREDGPTGARRVDRSYSLHSRSTSDACGSLYTYVYRYLHIYIYIVCTYKHVYILTVVCLLYACVHTCTYQINDCSPHLARHSCLKVMPLCPQRPSKPAICFIPGQEPGHSANYSAPPSPQERGH